MMQWAMPASAMLMLGILSAPVRSAELGLNLGLSASAEVGVSEQTRELIQGLPAEVRAQLILALKEAQPIVDKSVLSYLDRVDAILAKQLVNLQCTAVGTAIQVGEEMFEPIRGPAQPVKDIVRLWEKQASAYEPESQSPHKMRKADHVSRRA